MSLQKKLLLSDKLSKSRTAHTDIGSYFLSAITDTQRTFVVVVVIESLILLAGRAFIYSPFASLLLHLQECGQADVYAHAGIPHPLWSDGDPQAHRLERVP